ncbi:MULTISPECIES: hypothetical protein [Gilvimarinus]|uniref:hypothetical protein n=1 Tax=Gilvimarinus TaxID=940550 RepID=UPI00035C47BD|nr:MULTISPECIES: hypothetical protein [Gilvimarinus]UTF61251.1 hypothetical protein NHM04_05480 [Gilvimarinus sp. DA14]
MSASTGRWKKRLVYSASTVAILGILVALGFWMIQSPERAQSLGTFAEASFWWLTVSRWLAYTLLIISWPRISLWLAKSFVEREDHHQVFDYAMRWRWPLLRVLVVYELLFPFNIIGSLGSLA